MNKLKVFLHITKKIGWFTALSYYLQRIFLGKDKLIKLTLKGLKNPVFLRNKSYDTDIFYQIFIREELDFELKNSELQTIVDFGGNIGLSSLYLKRKYPRATVYCVEPESSNFQLLQRNISRYKNEIIPVQTGIWTYTGNLYVIDSGKGYASFQISEDPKSSRIIQTIPVISIPDFLNRFNIQKVNFLKMDIEGAEMDLFSHDDKSWINKLDVFAVEPHDNFKPGCSKLIMNTMANNFSYRGKGEYFLFEKKIQ